MNGAHRKLALRAGSDLEQLRRRPGETKSWKVGQGWCLGDRDTVGDDPRMPAGWTAVVGLQVEENHRWGQSSLLASGRYRASLEARLWVRRSTRASPALMSMSLDKIPPTSLFFSSRTL